MAAMRGARLQVGSASWIAEERSSARQIAQEEVVEFSYSARNELDWLNEHMAGIFDENEVNIVEMFKTPGKLRGKTPRTARKAHPAETRMPLSDVFAATPNGSTHPVSQKVSRLQSRLLKTSPSPIKAAPTRQNVFSPQPTSQIHATQDSGYHGSQDIGSVNIHADDDIDESPRRLSNRALHTTTTVPLRQDSTRVLGADSPEKTFQTAREEQTTRVLADITTKAAISQTASDMDERLDAEEMEGLSSTHEATSPIKSPADGVQFGIHSDGADEQDGNAGIDTNLDARSQSDASSPIRPVVRKSSLNFASLPAREPLTGGKSIGARVSRTSHLDHNRTSYYNRPTGGKSLGYLAKMDDTDDDNHDEMGMDQSSTPDSPMDSENVTLHHTKTYTQRLQDQINLLGKPQSNSIGQPKAPISIPSQQAKETAHVVSTTPKSASPVRKDVMQHTPGAFPEDYDDDDWIDPPAVTEEITESRPTLPKSYTADVMEGIQGKQTIGEPDFYSAKQKEASDQTIFSQQSAAASQPPRGLGHGKSTSVSVVPSAEVDTRSLYKHASNPSLVTVSETGEPLSPFKSPSRAFRDSPLKQVKNKLSSILKSSRGLLASSAAISAEGKSMLSPSNSRLALHLNGSSESVISKYRVESQSSVTSQQIGSPTRPVAGRTRASTEREEKRQKKEIKHMEEQMEKLDKAREKEREKARIFSKEREKIVDMEKRLASKKEEDKLAMKELPKATRTSPRKAQAPENEHSASKDVEMMDAPPMPPVSVAKSAGTGQSTRTKEVKRPVKPAKDAPKSKQAPMVIKVKPGSQHSQYHPATSRPSTNLHDRTGSSTSQSQHQLSSKSSQASLQTKGSMKNLKAGTSSASRAKTQEMNAKKKEQDEREAQRRRDEKTEMERKRAAAQDEQQRRQDTELQKQKNREQSAHQAEEKRSVAERQAAIEKAKQTKAPPPAVRSRPNGPPDFALAQERPGSSAANRKMDAQPPRPPSRMTSNVQRSHEDPNRPTNAVFSNAPKPGVKRTLITESADDAKRPQSRAGPGYQAKDAKRRRTSENFEDELDTSNPPNIKGLPFHPPGGYKKDIPTKPAFPSGYSNAPPSASRDLYKATVKSQHNGQAKTAHPLDMAQISKVPIPFAPNPNPGATASSYKTPARPGPFNGVKSAAKSGPRSSPRFQNGDAIELPEIQTDDESDEDDEAKGLAVAAWADSPDLRKALARQETMDPSHIFGPPAPLNMEEVFNKSKERWPKFRARTSSANWGGADRLTEEDIRKDLAARDKLRREGGWSYEMSKEMM